MAEKDRIVMAVCHPTEILNQTLLQRPFLCLTWSQSAAGRKSNQVLFSLKHKKEQQCRSLDSIRVFSCHTRRVILISAFVSCEC